MDKFANLPSPLKWLLGATGLGSLVAIGVFGGRGNWKLLLIFAIVLLLLLLLFVGGFVLWNYLQRRKQNARLRGELHQSTTAAPRGMSATDLAKLDNLRKKFQEGVEAFRARGKDLYTLPWYVIIGEPGSGKTEAVRHCNVGFPPGMHEGENDTGYMGAGGTINMNWWFTNFAVLLDTAGRLVFEDVKPGETSEWKEFLKLLKKNRPYCPINGLLLVVPSDSLIKDSADQIAAKAGKIAQQLDVIQRVLDFRFPVYVVITKSDKINGFREFFESVTDPQLQHQMMGWSNPDLLDSAFKADAVDKHLTQVADRLRRRRLGLMRDPVPETAPRRTDEVDALFALPNSLLMLAPRLRRYLETIFMPGEWSAKPLFLRGIYFTSSMREGAALDQELAEAIGVAADELPEGKVWERDRAYFLRDLFMEKVFKEKGLVTRATNTGDMLRRRQMIIYGASLAALVIFIAIAWLGMRTVRGQVKDRADYWVAATAVGWGETGWWNRSVVKLDDESGAYSLVTNRQPFGDQHMTFRMTIGEFQQKLRELAESDIQGKLTTPGLAHSYNTQSKEAQRTIFETGVLKPLRDAAAKTIRTPLTDAAQGAQPDVLASLIRLESDILSRRGGDPVEMDGHAAELFLGHYSRFATGQDASLDTNLVSVMAWTYSSNKVGRGSWPPAWLSDTVIENKVATNALLMVGLESCIRAATNTIRDVGTNWADVSALQTACRAYSQAESDFFRAVKAGDRDGARRALATLGDRKTRVDSRVSAAARNELFKEGVLFGAARQSYTNQIMTFAWGAFDKIERAQTNGLRKHPDYPVFVNIARRLKAEKSAFSSSLLSFISTRDAEEFGRFDDQLLALSGSAKLYDTRGSLFDRAGRLSDEGSFANLTPGATLTRLSQVAADRTDIAKGFGAYAAYGSNDVAMVARFYLGGEFAESFMRQAGKSLDPVLGFPFFKNSSRTLPLAGLEGACNALQIMAANLQSVEIPDAKYTNAWKVFTGRVEALGAVATFLKGKKGEANTCTISLHKLDENSKDAEKTWRSRFRAIRLVTSSSDPPRPVRVEFDEDQQLAKVPIGSACSFQLFQRIDDKDPTQTLAESGDWGSLALLLKYQSAPEKEGDNRAWLVRRPFGGSDAGVLTLRLVFDQPVPDLASWPAN